MGYNKIHHNWPIHEAMFCGSPVLTVSSVLVWGWLLAARSLVTTLLQAPGPVFQPPRSFSGASQDCAVLCVNGDMILYPLWELCINKGIRGRDIKNAYRASVMVLTRAAFIEVPWGHILNELRMLGGSEPFCILRNWWTVRESETQVRYCLGRIKRRKLFNEPLQPKESLV